MVVILRRGNSNIPPLTVNCAHCSSRLRYEQSEGRPYADRGDEGLIFDCPVCQKEIWISRAKD